MCEVLMLSAGCKNCTGMLYSDDIVAIGKPERQVTKSFTLWQQVTVETMRRNHSIYCLFAPPIYGCSS